MLFKDSSKLRIYYCLRLISHFRPVKPIHASKLINIENIQYELVKNEMCAIIEKNVGKKYFFMDKKALNPIPMLISTLQINEYKQIQEALSCVIQAIVLNYFSDTRIQLAFCLKDKVKNILELYRNQLFYQIGSYR